MYEQSQRSKRFTKNQGLQKLTSFFDCFKLFVLSLSAFVGMKNPGSSLKETFGYEACFKGGAFNC